MLGQARRSLTVELRIIGSPGGETVDVSVHHAEICSDQNSVVDFKVGCALSPGLGNVFGGDLLAALLHMTGNVEERF